MLVNAAFNRIKPSALSRRILTLTAWLNSPTLAGLPRTANTVSGPSPVVLRVYAEQRQYHLVHDPHQEVIVDRPGTEDEPLPQ